MSRALLAAAAALLALPLVIALTDGHLSGQPTALVISTAAAALAVSALVLQPLLAGGGRLRWHRVLGAVALGLVLVHLGGLFVVGAEDTLFALSLDGPTRGRMATLATIALIAVVALGVLRARLPMAGVTWRILHALPRRARDPARLRPRAADRRRARRLRHRRARLVRRRRAARRRRRLRG